MLEDVDFDNMQLSSMVSSQKKDYKYSIGYQDDDYKVKPLRTMLLKTSVYVKSSDGETKCMSSWLKMMIC